MKNVIWVFLFLFSSCSFFKGKIDLSERVTINSPIEVDIYSPSDQKIGSTPLELSKDQLAKIQKDGIITFVAKKNGYFERQFSFLNPGVTNVEIALKKIEEQDKKELLTGVLSDSVNTIAKKMVAVQESLLANKNYESSEVLNQLIKDYPNISTFYVLQAVGEIQVKRYVQAKILLEKSLALDKNNELANMYLNYANMRLKNE